MKQTTAFVSIIVALIAIIIFQIVVHENLKDGWRDNYKMVRSDWLNAICAKNDALRENARLASKLTECRTGRMQDNIAHLNKADGICPNCGAKTLVTGGVCTGKRSMH